jgi:endonuclease YncB( thermonuclease family)
MLLNHQKRNRLKQHAENVFGVKLKRDRFPYECLVLLLIPLIGLNVLIFAQQFDKIAPTPETFQAFFGDHSEVYDGDTIKDVYVVLREFEEKAHAPAVLFPGILLKKGTLYAVIDIRIAGIDTPEKRPRKAGRTPESLEREKAAAKKAQIALDALLSRYDFEFEVANVELGKYAGRVVADVFVGPERISVADFMIAKGLGYRYDGGSKKPFDLWYE